MEFLGKSKEAIYHAPSYIPAQVSYGIPREL